MSRVSTSEGGTNELDREIVVGDLLRYLTGLADLQRDSRTGNVALADAIRSLVGALRPYRSNSVLDLSKLLADPDTRKMARRAPRKPAVELPPGLATLAKSVVEGVLADDRYSKGQLADMGFQRFGISRSKLCRLPKADAVEAIRSALEHERSLEAISRQAEVAGRRRAQGY